MVPQETTGSIPDLGSASVKSGPVSAGTGPSCAESAVLFYPKPGRAIL